MKILDSLRKSITIVLALALTFSSFPLYALADTTITYSGTSGTRSWTIDSDGALTISPTDGVSGTLENRQGNVALGNGVSTGTFTGTVSYTASLV